jgi:hypothetical protein
MRPILLIGLAILTASSAMANAGDSIEESLQRYGELCLIDHGQDRLIWDTGKVEAGQNDPVVNHSFQHI